MLIQSSSLERLFGQDSIFGQFAGKFLGLIYRVHYDLLGGTEI